MGSRRPSLSGLGHGLILVVATTIGCDGGPTGTPPDGAIDLAAPWRTASPATVGMDANALFIAGEVAADLERMRSLIVVREGRIAYERYYGGMAPDSLADVRSVTKSVTGSLAALALRRGSLRGLDRPVRSVLDGDDVGLRPEHAAITIRHLLTMAAGVDWDEGSPSAYNAWATSPDPVGYLLARNVDSSPGSTFTYNSAAVHLLGVAIEHAVDMPLEDFADETLFEPLGIRRRVWETLAPGVNAGSGLALRPRDLARFGQLYLQEGWSGERSVLPRAWVAQATSPTWSGVSSSQAVDRLGYGYLWWIDEDHEAFMAWGYGGQFVYVAPRLDLVVVATTDWLGLSQDGGSGALASVVLSIIVDRVLPAVL